MQVEGEKLKEPEITFNDFLKTLKQIRPSVSTADIADHIKFTNDFGQEVSSLRVRVVVSEAVLRDVTERNGMWSDDMEKEFKESCRVGHTVRYQKRIQEERKFKA